MRGGKGHYVENLTNILPEEKESRGGMPELWSPRIPGTGVLEIGGRIQKWVEGGPKELVSKVQGIGKKKKKGNTIGFSFVGKIES